MILQKLQMNIPDVQDLNFLQSEGFYYQVLKLVFRSENIFDKKTLKSFLAADTPKKIQILIDFIGTNILGMKIEDIKGVEIQEGNILHIKSFLELILALTSIENEDESQDEKARSPEALI